VIAERYRLERPLGMGSSATVWEATDLVLERLVAVKLLRDAAADDQAERERLRREARTLARLAHPRIITVWDFFETELPGAPEQPVLVTELVGGESLADRLENGPLPWPEAVRICGQLADALRAAHEVGIVHRDVKPGNVVLIGDGVKLLDFGIARAPNDTQLTGNLTIGTPLCMAPEQIRGRGAEPESDIYALGCVLFWCLTGRPPFQGGDVADIFEAHLCDPPPPLDVPDLPPQIAEFCHACLEKNPSFRPDADRAVAALFPGEANTAILGAVRGDPRRSGSWAARLGTGTLSTIRAGLTTGRFSTGRVGPGRSTSQGQGQGHPGTDEASPERSGAGRSNAGRSSAGRSSTGRSGTGRSGTGRSSAGQSRAGRTRVGAGTGSGTGSSTGIGFGFGVGNGVGAGTATADPSSVGADTVAHRFRPDRPPLVPVLAAVLLFAAVAVTAVLLLIGAPGSGTGTPQAAPTVGPNQGAASGPAVPVSPSVAAITFPPFTATPTGDAIRYLESMRQQITGLVAAGPATINASTGGDLQNSIIDIENSVISAQKNGGAAHLQEIRNKISLLDGRLAGLVGQGRIAAGAADQLQHELNQLSNTVTD
jgi:serine/threonine-protein kinase